MSSMNTIRSFKLVNNTVAFDYISTIIGALLLSKLSKVPLVLCTIILFVMGEVLHYFFNIKTNSLAYLGIL